jgi:hypothetical protein
MRPVYFFSVNESIQRGMLGAWVLERWKPW